MSFWKTVKIPTPEGKPLSVAVNFKRMRRRDLAEFFDSLDAGDVSAAEAFDRDVDAVMRIIEDWKLTDRPFSRESVEWLLDEYPAAAMELLKTFSDAHTGTAEKKR